MEEKLNEQHSKPEDALDSTLEDVVNNTVENNDDSSTIDDTNSSAIDDVVAMNKETTFNNDADDSHSDEKEYQNDDDDTEDDDTEDDSDEEEYEEDSTDDSDEEEYEEDSTDDSDEDEYEYEYADDDEDDDDDDDDVIEKGIEALAYLEEDKANRLTDFLVYSGIKDAKTVYDEDTNIYEVRVPSKSYEKAQALFDVFSENELKTEESSNEPESEPAGNLYTNSTEKYKDYVSSAYTFIICGLAGLVVLLLNDFKVIHIYSQSGLSCIMVNVILGGLFLAFIIIGIFSFVSAKKIKVKADKEKQAKDDVIEWLKENVDIDTIEASYDDTIAEEMKYFNRQSFVKEKIKEQYADLDDELVDYLTDTYIETIFHA